MLKAIGSKGALSSHTEYYGYISDLLENEAVRSMDGFRHHGSSSCLQHSLNVSFMNYRFCKALGLDARAGARGGLLHDLFLYDWHVHSKKKGGKRHGLTHPAEALKNARKYFDITDKEADIILKHMFPVTHELPRYRETAVICITDKICAIWEFLTCGFQRLIGRKG